MMHKLDLWATADLQCEFIWILQWNIFSFFTIIKKHNDINFSLSSFAIYWVVKSHVFVERLNEFIVVCKCFELIQTVSARVTRFVSNGGSFSKMNLGGQHVTSLKGTIYVLLSHIRTALQSRRMSHSYFSAPSPWDVFLLIYDKASPSSF